MLKSDEAKAGVSIVLMLCVSLCFIVVQLRGCEETVAKFNSEAGKVSDTFSDPTAERDQRQAEVTELQ